MESEISASNNEITGEEDRLSNLPDSILVEIMSYLSTKEAIQTSLLGNRWKYLWKNLPSLRLDSQEFPTVNRFNEFMSVVLSPYDNSIPLHSLDFMSPFGTVEPAVLDKVIEYALSHQVQELKLILNFLWLPYKNKSYDEFPISLFSGQNWLTSLEILIHHPGSKRPLVPKSLNLSSLSILRLSNVTFCKGDNMDRAEPFSNCNKLKTLEIKNCAVEGIERHLCISNATLANLTIFFHPKPSAKPYQIELSTPNLSSFSYKGDLALPLTVCKISFLEQVDIATNYYSSSTDASRVISWLKVLANVASLTLSCSTLEDISSVLDDTEPPCFRNLKTLKVEEDNPDDLVDNLLRNTHPAEVAIEYYSVCSD